MCLASAVCVQFVCQRTVCVICESAHCVFAVRCVCDSVFAACRVCHCVSGTR